MSRDSHFTRIASLRSGQSLTGCVLRRSWNIWKPAHFTVVLQEIAGGYNIARGRQSGRFLASFVAHPFRLPTLNRRNRGRRTRTTMAESDH